MQSQTSILIKGLRNPRP